MDITLFVLPCTIIAVAYLVRIIGEVIINLKAEKQMTKLMKPTTKLMALATKYLERYIKEEFDDSEEDCRIIK